MEGVSRPCVTESGRQVNGYGAAVELGGFERHGGYVLLDPLRGCKCVVVCYESIMVGRFWVTLYTAVVKFFR